jgi:hypothetical protein
MTIDEQISCVEREIRLRERNYPRWVEARRMSLRKAGEEMAAMRAVLETLRRVAASERLL